ncbi:MAG TPA: hypothetical protein VFN95_04625, partial [Flavitalea sp.]|nr:hypothetical protein [Flavitalea sp.]
VNGSKLSNQIFTISAKTPAALDKLKEKWKEFAAAGSFDQHNVQDACQTLLNGRVPMEYRFGALIKTKEELISALNKADVFVNRESPVCLKIGNLSFPNYSQIESLLETADVFRMQYAHVERSVQKYLAGESLEIYLQERNDQRINDFIGVYILTAGLMDLGLSPELVTGEGAGIWVSLVISGMLSVEEAFMRISGKGSDSIHFSRPKISFFDSVSKHVIKPFYFDSEYIDQLISNCSFRDEQAFFPSPDLSDSSQPLAHYVHKARVLSDSQFTFKKFLDEWDAILKKAGFSLNYLLYDDELLTNKENDRASERLLLAFVIISSLEKLNKKWELPEQNSLEDYRFKELLDLVDDEVLTKEDLVQLLTGDHRNDVHIAEKLNSRQQNINVSKPYTLLRKVHQFLKEFGNEAEWLKKAMTCTADSDLKGITVLTLGEVTGPSGVATSLLPGITADIDYCIKNVLLKLWLEGITIHWDKIFPEGSYLKMALPCYPFEGKSFWKQNKYHIRETNVAERDFPASKTIQIDEEKTLDHSKEPTSEKDFLITRDENWNGIFYYKPVWKEVAIGPKSESHNSQVLIFTDKIGIGKALAANFEKHTLVISSDQYRHINNSTFAIDIDQPQHYEEILQKVGTFSKLYFLWGIEQDEKIESVSAFQSFENRAVKSFFRLCKALASLNSDKPYELIVVTDSLQKVNSYNIPLFPYAAPLLGIAKVMAKENPNICVCCVDINSPSPHDISILARENSAGPLLEIAYREERRYVKALVPQPDYRNRSVRKFIFRKGGVYIILGGMGGVGFELSLFLAS